MMSYYEFIGELKLKQSELSKLLYELYLDCCKQDKESEG